MDVVNEEFKFCVLVGTVFDGDEGGKGVPILITMFDCRKVPID